MTTILADARLGIVVADSNISDEDRVWVGRKVSRVRGGLVALSGDYGEGACFLEWCRGGFNGPAPRFGNSCALVLTHSGLTLFNYSVIPDFVSSGREAIGTGAKAAMCAYEALGWTDPKKAVRIVCKHDAGSRGPVRTYRL